jgi:hypothetical protein
VLGGIVDGISPERLRVDDQPWLTFCPNDIARVQVGRLQDGSGCVARQFLKQLQTFADQSVNLSSGTFVAEGYVPGKGAELNLNWPSEVMGNYFRAAGIPLLRGRYFTEADRVGFLSWSL